MVSIPTNRSKPGKTIFSLNTATKTPETISSQPICFRDFIEMDYFGNKSATSAFSSFNSASVAAIFALLKSLSGTP